MRKRVRILILAAIVAAVVVPVGFALSLERGDQPVADTRSIIPVSQISTATGPIVPAANAAVPALPDVPDGAKLLLTGSVLFGLAAAMRRSNRHHQ